MLWVLLAIAIVGNLTAYYDEPKICPPFWCECWKSEKDQSVEVTEGWVL